LLGIAALNTNLSVCYTTHQAQRGMTLVELVITIVIIGIASAALFSAMAAITGRSADPMLRQQSLAIAEAYMEEITLQAFPASTTCAASNDGAGRESFDDVCDYNGLFYSGPPDTRFAPRNAVSTVPLVGLNVYQVRVQIEAQALNGISSADALRILVTVTDPGGQVLALTGYRARY
jgi:MSHA pilin protein MshD